MSRPYANAVQVAFVGGDDGEWAVDAVLPVAGPLLAMTPRLAVIEASLGSARPDGGAWCLTGTTSNSRYSERRELDAMAARQEGLGRPTATLAALIPIRKSPAWWALAQDERRAIFEAQSHHIAIGMETLPGVARRLHHSRELGEPFDFLTWFEFAPDHEAAFNAMLVALRATPEWDYVEAEVDIRLRRVPAAAPATSAMPAA